MKIHKALTIAGSDSGGGAGIQADLKTFQELMVYGMSVITAVTAQNTIGVHGVYPVPGEGVMKQLQSIGEDLTPNAVKTGMLFSADIIQEVVENIRRYKWEKVIVDPVMIAKGGASLLQDEAVHVLKEKLLPLSLVVTPNIPEAEVLAGMSIKNLVDKKEAAKRIHSLGPAHVVIKGGHDDGGGNDVIDVLFDGNDFYDFSNSKVHTQNTHGTGCTYSAIITAELAKGRSVIEAVDTAKRFIHAAIVNDLGIGNGHGPTNHWAFRTNKNGCER